MKPEIWLQRCTWGKEKMWMYGDCITLDPGENQLLFTPLGHMVFTYQYFSFLFELPYYAASFSWNQVISAYSNRPSPIQVLIFRVNAKPSMKDQFKLILCHSRIRTPNYELITIQVYKLMRISIHSTGVKILNIYFMIFFSLVYFLLIVFLWKIKASMGETY